MNRNPPQWFDGFGLKSCMLPVALTMFGLMICAGEFQTATAEEQDRTAEFGDPKAKMLAVRVHSETRAMDELPRFYYRVESGNGDVETMLDVEECTLARLKMALDEPVSKERWFQSTETLAWSGRQALCSTSDRKYKNQGKESSRDAFQQDRVWTNNEAFQRSESAGRSPRFVYVQKPEQIWEGRFANLAYFRVTPHRFWWGSSSEHSDSISRIPPERASYRFAASQRFDDELCDVVESANRAETLWVGRESGRLRGVLVWGFLGAMPSEPFYKTDIVQKIAGRGIASQQEYHEWTTGLSESQTIELSLAWNEKYFELFGPGELIRFRDYREVAPGIWIPFREDRAFTHPASDGGKRRKFIHLWIAVQDVKTDVDLAETIVKLKPKEGEEIQDQRFGIVVNYKFRRDRTQTELLEMVDAERQKLASNAAILKQLIAPIDEMVGKPAPVLPAEGWIGGEIPKLDGKPYLIHFWATWCGPCKNDLPVLKKLAADGVRVIGMHPAGTPADDVVKVIHDQGLGYPTFLASSKTGDGDRKIGGYPTGMFPYCILVDSGGRVAGHGSLRPELLAKLRSFSAENENRDAK